MIRKKQWVKQLDQNQSIELRQEVSYQKYKYQSQQQKIHMQQLNQNINKVSTRYETDKMRYFIKSKKDKLSVEFDDKFGLKYLDYIKPKQFFIGIPFDQYKIRKKENKLQFKHKDQTLSLQLMKQSHQRVAEQLKLFFDLNYFYFKSMPDSSHVQRNKRFKQICEKPNFKLIFPQIKCLIYIQHQQNDSPFLQDKKPSIETISFKKEELIILITSNKKQSIKHIIKYMETYTEQTVIFGLDDYFQQAKVKQSGLSLSEMETIINRLIEYLKNQIILMGIKCELIVKKIQSYVPFSRKQRYKDNSDNFGIKLYVEGMFQSLPQFYFNLIKLFKLHPVTLGRVQDINMEGNFHFTEQKYKQTHDIVIFFGSDTAIAVLNLHQKFKDWVHLKRQLRKVCFLISQLKGFTRQQIEILIKQHRQAEQFMNGQQYDNFVDYTFRKVDEKSFQIHCEKNVVPKFISRAFDYLKANTRVQTKRQEFITEFQVHLFMKISRFIIQNKYSHVKFFIKDGALYSRSKDCILKDLEIEMKNQRRKMLKKMTRIPTIKPLKRSPKYQIIQDQFLAQQYCHEQYLRTIHYLFNARINIFIKPVQTISRCHSLLIPIIDKYFQRFHFFMDHFKTNQLSTQRYEKYVSDKVNDRIITYSMSKSKYVNQMLVWFIETDERSNLNLKKMKWDIDDTISKYKHDKKLQFVIPYHMWKNQYYFGNFFIEIFKMLKRHEDSVKVENITIYYETQNKNAKIYDITRRAFEMANKDVFELKTKMYLGVEEIEKIVLIEHYSTFYWTGNENKLLSPLNSYIFNYQKSKKAAQYKVPIFIVSVETIQYQYLLCLQQMVYYKIDRLCRITKFMVETNKILDRFCKVVKKYFSFSDYIVVYMNKEQTQLQGKKLYFWQKSSNPQQGQQKIKRIEISNEDKLIQKKDSELDINVKKNDIVPKFIVQTHEDFLPEVKRIILQEE